MTSLTSAVIVFTAALAFAGCAAAGGAGGRQSAAPPTEDTGVSELLGRWIGVRSTSYFADGATRANSTARRCSMELTNAQVVVDCESGAGKRHRIVSAIHIIARGRYEAEVLECEVPQSIGWRSIIEWRLENGTLFTTGHPQNFPANASRAPVKTESEWTRE
jgi:hypothetical protein